MVVKKAKKKYGGDVGTCWKFVFPSDRMAVLAAVELRRISKSSKMLMPGTPVEVKGDTISLTWKFEVQYHTITRFLYDGNRRHLFGVGGKFQPWYAEVIRDSDPARESAQPLAGNISEINADAGAATSSDTSTNIYPSLPIHLKLCQFDRMNCWGIGTHKALSEHGFIHVQSFVPEIMLQPARKAIETRFGAVCASFTNGYAVNDLRCINQIPSEAWDKKKRA